MKLTCLVDNGVRPHTRFQGEHGLAFLIESEAGKILFDTGASGTVLLHNMDVARVTPSEIDGLALSHGHRDHTGGLPAFLERRPGLPLYAHPDITRERFSERKGERQAVGIPLSPQELGRLTDLHLSAEPQEIMPGVWTTGEIRERPEPEGRSSRHFVREGEDWLPDPYRDDMALVVETARGPLLVCGCCHAGLLNTLAHVQKVLKREPVAVIGGTHLIAADQAHLQRLTEVLQRLGPPWLYLNHCTGEAAYVSLALVLGERVAPFPAGAVLELESA